MAGHLRGIGVSPGIASGPVARLGDPPRLPADPGPGAGRDAELPGARRALEEVAADLTARADRVGGDASAVLAAQALMATDPVLLDKVGALLDEGRPAAHAVSEAFDEFRALLAQAGPYMAERAADLADVRDRAVALLLGEPMPGIPDPGHPFVLVATDLAPADTATLDTGRVLAIVTEAGGPTSHTAIISKSLGIPAVVSCHGATALADGTAVLVDGGEGELVVSPTDADVSRRLSELAASRAAATAVSGPGRTADDVGVQLLVNLGSGTDVVTAAAVDAEGVGLLRTEFLFLDRDDAPGVEEQRALYAEVFEAFTGRKVVVRTLDAGADKPLGFVETEEEANPALGMRGLRTSRRHPALLDDQLRALARAAAGSGADVWVMAPMVSTPGEASEFVALARSHGLPVAGAMVEVPAAALRADALVATCDFVSLGTNDLAQYCFAADRMVGELADLLDPWQPALLELVRLTGAAGRAHATPVGVCGEAASDPLLALVLVGLGATSLSMAPTAIAEVRLALSRHTFAECEELARTALAADDGSAARAAVKQAAAPAAAKG